MSTLQLQLVLIMVLLLVNAAFAGAEIALISLRSSQVERLSHRGRAGKVLADLVSDPNSFLATIQIGITLAGLLASAAAATSFADELAPRLQPLGAAARPVSIAAVTLVLTFLTLVIGELAPKRIAMARAERWALLAALPLHWLARFSKPAVWLLSHTTGLLVRVVGVRPDEAAEELSDDELRDMLLSRSGLRRQRQIFEATFEVGERVVRDILVPRRDVTLVPTAATSAEAVAILRESGHSRAPLADDLDDVKGMVHLIDVAGSDRPAAAVARPVLFLPETLGVLEALRRMQHERQQLSVVVDEHGGGEGILAIEDVLEEIVGEIYDEFDPDQQQVSRVDGAVLVDGAFPVHDLPDIGVDLPEGDYTTVAGLVLDRLGHVPEAGERVSVGRWDIEVTEATTTTIKTVRIRRSAP